PLRHADAGAVTARRAAQRQADAGVAGGAFDYPATRSQQAPFLGVLDDEQRRAVLDRAAGIEEFGLAENCAPRLLGGAPQLDQRRVSDRADKAVANLHASLRILRNSSPHYRRRKSRRHTDAICAARRLA